eukprot:CAMPEP_0173059378 /NCGR_PEP_ID=MMETSP1102-20130122/1939_1 /TAXON_ID=49646 /ORGANISM="Geminigera sp., Strain Caron Lab Isolate" /LENGTH=47 /DNA_ID= /DNA_START= /DNA_END= /DNA_ORIENTATION=
MSAYPGVDNSKVIDNDAEKRHAGYACGAAGALVSQPFASRRSSVGGR